MEIKDIGLFLKEKREEKSISLEEIEEILKIRKKYLTAIEEGNFSILPGVTYVLGYLRNYCKYLNISDEEIDGIIKSYKGLEKQQEKIDANKEEVLSLRKKRTINFERKSNLVNFRYVYLAGFVIFLFVGVLFFNNYLRNAKNYPLPSPEVNTIIDVVTETPENSTIEVSEDIIITEEIVVSKIPVLKVFAKDNTWFKVLFDDTLIFEGILLKSEKMSFKTRNNLKLLTMFPNNLVAFIDDEETDLNYSTKDNQMFEYQFNKISENS